MKHGLTHAGLAVALALPLEQSAMADPAGGFPEQIEVDEQTLRLSGSGTAYYLGVIDVYDAALHVSGVFGEGSGADSQCLTLRYRQRIKRSDFVKAAETVLARQHSERHLAQFKDELARLHAAYRDVVPGDEYRLCHASTSGMSLHFNGQPVIRFEDPEFARLYFGIWLGDPPLSAPLRERLLDRARKG